MNFKLLKNISTTFGGTNFDRWGRNKKMIKKKKKKIIAQEFKN